MKRFPPWFEANARAAAVLAAAAVVAAALHFTEALVGPFDLKPPAKDYGKLDYRIGDHAWPRTAVDATGMAVTVPRAPERVASLYWSLDEYAYSVIPPERIVGVSETAFIRRVSNVAEFVERHKPAVAENPEVLLKLSPDLVLAASDSKTDFTETLRNGGVRVFQVLTLFRTIDEVGQTILLTGYLSGEDERARQAYNAFSATIDRARRRKPAGMKAPRVLGLGGGRYTYGDETLFHDIIRTLGAVNVAGENGLHGYDVVSSELVLRWDPEWIVIGADFGKEAEAIARISSDPAMSLTTAARTGRIVALDNKVFLPMSPYTARLVDALGQTFYPETN